MTRIDFVVTWVDGNDPIWQKNRDSYKDVVSKELNTDSRYRDWQLMKYWFRSVERYAPWVNKIFFITEGHLPDWLNTEHPKLVVVKHSDYIDGDYLPTFNSNVIELNIHKIKDLSENFVLFNDDTFVNGAIKEEDFFIDGIPRDIGIFSPQVPSREGIGFISLNNVGIINDYYTSRAVLRQNFFKYFRIDYSKHLLKNIVVLPWKPILGFYDHHLPVSYKKSTFEMLWELETTILKSTSANRFRTREDVNHWLMRYWQLCSGDFMPRTVKFGRSYNIDSDMSKICLDIQFQKHKLVCLNDGDKVVDFEEKREKLTSIFESRYPDKSLFEI
ncbi:stealth family protein [Streptococcus himalayensis]|uniref:Exopolysaccharide phosphotransferase cps2G n=1 Tax=Streptococcus himalayensis TaxID=1888195 RepID=A0A917A383_9STRE|nr:stealth family protein [Streptococcus himalayensis]GGE22942.1 exopolysaccharide phosphotransferase cps2G [Streptococcus himalayensis]